MALDYLFSDFLKISNQRQSNGFAPSPVQFSEIESYCRLNRVDLDPYEVEAIIRLDSIARRVSSEKK